MEVAVVGIGCRFPGAENTAEYWRVLRSGENQVIDIPEERWHERNKSSRTRAGLIEGSENVWDYALHDISSYEGREMDPQQKMVLDSVHMALENAGITKKQVSGSDTSVFIGAMNNDYRGLNDDTTTQISNFQVTGGNNSLLSARVSYNFNLLGNSVTVDSACSSSAVAIDLACNQLTSGKCEMAIAGGVNSILSPDFCTRLLEVGIVSPSGTCHAFSDKADGYVRGEGCGIVILKPLNKAIEDNDRILATIVTATNQDGGTVSPIMAPSGHQQVALMEKLYRTNDISPDTVDYVEAHGTGTKIGDPVEAAALGQFFKRSKSNQSLLIGTVKTNIGHLESAAGVASLIKVILMHQHQTLAPTLNFDRQSQVIPLSEHNIEVVTEVRPWPTNNRSYLRSAVNCFGFGGTNCHMIVTTGLRSTCTLFDHRETGNSSPRVVCLSAKNSVSLEEMVEDLCNDGSDYALDDLSYTSTKRRNHYKCRKAVVGKTVDEIKKNMKQCSTRSDTTISKKNKVIMVFPGVGTSWQGMCGKLMTNSYVFRSKIGEINGLLQKYVKWDLMEKLCSNNDEEFFHPGVNSILIFAVEVALFSLFTEIGVFPDAILGQSMGEIAAAVASGGLQLEQAVDIIYYRTKSLEEATGGNMFFVRGILEDKVMSVLQQFDNGACISLYYSPVSFVISCDADLSYQIKAQLLEENADAQFTDLKVTSAFHSHHMSNSAQHFIDSLVNKINGSPPKIPLYSTVTGELSKVAEFTSPDYWKKNIRNPVLFHQAILSSYDEEKHNIYLEIGPKPVLTPLLNEIFNRQQSVIGIPTVDSGDDLEHALRSITCLYNLGIDIEWKDFLDLAGRLIDIPRYKFNPIPNRLVLSLPYQKLMGVELTDHRHRFVRPTIDDHLTFKILLDNSQIPSIFTHKVHENNIIPGALYAEAGLAIWLLIKNVYTMEPCEVSVRFLKPVIMKDKDLKMLDVTVDNSDVVTFTVLDGRFLCASGKILPSKSKDKSLYLDDIKDRCGQKMLSDVVYNNLSRIGFRYGQKMILLGQCVRNSYESLTEMKLTPIMDELDKTVLHPVIIDSLLQTVCVFDDNYKNTSNELYPVKINGLVVFRHPSEHMLVYTKLLREDNESLSFSVDLCLSNGLIVASIREVLFRVVNLSVSTLKRFQMISWKKVDESRLDVPRTMMREKTKNVKDPPFLALVQCSETNRKHEDGFYLISIDENLRQKQLSALKSMNQSISVVIMLPNITMDDKNITGDVLVDQVVEIMLWLKDVFQYITEKLTVSKAVVLTLNWWTQTNEIKLPVFSSTNPISRAVMGFLRSAQKEVPFHLYVVDTDEATPMINSIENLLHKLTSPTLNGETEFILKQGDLCVCRCEPLLDEDDYVEIHPVKPRTDTGLFVDEHDVEFAMYINGYSKENPFLSLKTSILVFPNPDLFTPYIPHKLNGGATIFSKFCLEAVGRKKSEVSGPEVVSFYPVQESDRVLVPEACCFPLETFQGHYIPGMMTILVILWNLSQEVKKSNVVLHQDENEVKLLNLLRSMLGNVNVSACTIKDMKDGFSGRADQIISLVRMSNPSVVENLLRYQNIDDITTLSSLVPAEIQSKFYYSPVNFTMLTDHDMFKPSKLTALLPKLLSWLKTVGMDTLQDIKDCMSHKSTPFLRLINDRQVHKTNEIPIPSLRLERGNLISREAMYIVVGGLSGLGWECVKWLAENNAAVIICLNRRIPSQGDTLKMKDLSTRYSCTVNAFPTDVTNLDKTTQCLLALKEQYPNNPLRGILYGAAVNEDAMMSNIHRQNIRSVLAPKVRGTWNIHQITQNEDLDFFILHSSITAVLGNPGQTAYGCANAFMDGLVDFRRSIGLPAQSINWGPLDMGMLESKESKEATRRRFIDGGYNLITKEDIGSCLERAIVSNQPQIIVADLTNKIHEADIYIKSKLKDQVAFQYYSSSQENGGGETMNNHLAIDVNTLRETPECERHDILQNVILEIAQSILGSTISVESNFHDFGIDSLNATAMRNEVYKITRYSIPLALLKSSDVTVTSLTQNVNEHLFCQNNDLGTIGKGYSENLTYMERRYLKLNEIDKVYKSLHFIMDFEFQNYELNFRELKVAVEMALERNKYARTKFINGKDGDQEVKKTILSVADALNIYDVSDDQDERIDKLKFEKFDVNSSGPVRFILGNKRGGTRIIIVTHDIVFDKRTITDFLNDFLTCLQYTTSKDKVTEPVMASKEIKPAVEILESALKLNDEKLRQFWKHQLQQGIPNVSIDPTNTLTVKSGLCVVGQTILPKELYRRLKGIPGITAPTIIITMYQLLLANLSSSRRVCVTLPQDVRIPLPELTNHLGCLTNNVPLFVNIPDDHVLMMEFLKANHKLISECADSNGYFPFESLAELFPEGTAESNVDILLRHCVTYNDRSFTNRAVQKALDHNIHLEFLNIGSEHSYCESDLYINENKTMETINLTLHLTKDMYNEKKAQDVLQKLVTMLESDIDSSTISDLRRIVHI